MTAPCAVCTTGHPPGASVFFGVAVLAASARAALPSFEALHPNDQAHADASKSSRVCFLVDQRKFLVIDSSALQPRCRGRSSKSARFDASGTRSENKQIRIVGSPEVRSDDSRTRGFVERV
jgi:hypothetical protein